MTNIHWSWLLLFRIVIVGIIIVVFVLITNMSNTTWKDDVSAHYATAPTVADTIPHAPQPSRLQQQNRYVWTPSPVLQPTTPKIPFNCDLMAAYAITIVQHRRDNIDTGVVIQQLTKATSDSDQPIVDNVTNYALNEQLNTNDNDISYKSAKICHYTIETKDKYGTNRTQ